MRLETVCHTPLMDVSTDSPAGRWHQQIKAWARQRGWPIAEVVVEPGVSAGTPFAQRPAAKLWAKLRRGDVLVSTKLDRMFRNTRD